MAAKPIPQGAHRLVVVAYGSDEEIRQLLHDGYHASHRCHEPTCIRKEHIVVESKTANEDRKDCAKELWLMEITVGGNVQVVRSKYVCRHSPGCIPRVLIPKDET